MSQFSLEFFCEPLMDNPSYFSKKMFGGLAIYYNDLMIFVLTETPGEKTWKQETHDFDLWNGVLLCTSREHHEILISDFPCLRSHPVLGKWLYLPMSDSEFENTFEHLVSLVKNHDPRVGIVPGLKRKSKKNIKTIKKKKVKKKIKPKKVIKKFNG